MNMRRKNLGQLVVNVRDLPYRIAIWKKFGATEKVQMAERILRESAEEIARRQA